MREEETVETVAEIGIEVEPEADLQGGRTGERDNGAEEEENGSTGESRAEVLLARIAVAVALALDNKEEEEEVDTEGEVL